MKNNRLIYSTDKGRVCPECERPVAECRCKRKKVDTRSPRYSDNSEVRIQREVKGRRGKTVTVVLGLPMNEDELRDCSKSLKRLCGTGGSVKEGNIVIQGDHREILLQAMKNRGYEAKISGG